jgi:predicted kinase
MAKLQLNQPTLFLLYGFPGAGKTYFARQLSDDFKAAHVQADRIRHELFTEPRYDRQENQIVSQLTLYMTEEFISAGLSVILDMNAARAGQRRKLREIARRAGAQTVVIWFQIDMETAFARVSSRDRRRADDRYAIDYSQDLFERIASSMQNPEPTEEYVVLSGKHVYNTQRNMIIKRLYDMGLLHADQAKNSLAKPELVNLIPNPLSGRVDPSRRNISIR